MITFGNISSLPYLLPVTAVILFSLLFYSVWRRYAVRAIFRGRSSVILKSRFSILKEILVYISILLFFFLLLQPQWGESMREMKKEGTDLLILLDVSRSMNASDIEPSRLSRAKDIVRLLAGSLGGGRAGLVLFAGDAYLQCPLTKDIDAFYQFLDSADTSSVRLQGTDIGKALAEAERIFEKKRITSKMVVLITDGEDHEGRVLPAAERLKDKGVKIYTVGIGKSDGGLIPLSADDPSGDLYMRDANGELVRSRSNRELLGKIASATGGDFVDMSESFSGVKPIMEALSSETKSEFGTLLKKEMNEKYQIFALILLIALSAELLLFRRMKRE